MTTVITEESQPGHFYLKIETDAPSAVSMLATDNVVVSETLASGSPMLAFRFTDAIGDLMAHTYVDPSAEYKFFFGASDSDTQSGTFSISSDKNQVAGANRGAVQDVSNDMSFLHSSWHKFINKRHSRSWKNMRYSDVMRVIAAEAGLGTSEIQTTDGVYDIIQPDWSGLQMLKWIAARASSSTGHGAYVYGVTFDGDLIFKSLAEIITQSPKRDLFLMSDLPEANTARRDIIQRLGVSHDYAPMLGFGGFGVKYTYYDFNSKTFKTNTKKVSDLSQPQLADWFYLAEDHEDASQRLYGGRDEEIEDRAEAKVALSANSVQKLTVGIHGDSSFHIGDIVNIIIPGAPQSTLLINEQYSGRWMVNRVDHVISKADNLHQFSSTLHLVRSGINGTEVEGLVKSRTGKSFR